MPHQHRFVFRAMLPVAIWLLAGNATFAADDAVLLSSTAPGYVPGMVVAANERLTVPEGATTTLLFRTGEMLQLRGPFVGPLHSDTARNGSTSSAAGLVDALRFQGVDAAVVGGTRSLAALPRRRGSEADLVVDSERSATYCLSKTTSVWISRPDKGSDRIRLRRRGASREIAWPADAVRVEWPADVLIEDGDRFEINAASDTVPAVVTFRILDDRSPSDPAWIAQAALMGCRDQISDALRDLGQAISPR